MQIPGFKKAARSLSSSNAASSLKPLPPLAVVSVHHSLLLTYGYRLIYACFAISILIVLLPRLGHFLWLGLLVLLWCGLWRLYRQQVTSLFEGKVWYENDEWYIRHGAGDSRYLLAGEVVCWSFMLVLPLRDQKTGSIRYVVIANDSLSPADNARLRTWLRVCLRPKS